MPTGVRFICANLGALERQYDALNVERKYRNFSISNTKQLGNGEYYFDVVSNGYDATLVPEMMKYILVADCRVEATPEVDAVAVVEDIDAIINSIARGNSASKVIGDLVENILKKEDNSLYMGADGIDAKEDSDDILAPELGDDDVTDIPEGLQGQYAVTHLGTGRKQNLSYDQCVGLFGRNQFHDMLKGTSPEYVAHTESKESYLIEKVK